MSSGSFIFPFLLLTPLTDFLVLVIVFSCSKSFHWIILFLCWDFLFFSCFKFVLTCLSKILKKFIAVVKLFIRKLWHLSHLDYPFLLNVKLTWFLIKSRLHFSGKLDISMWEGSGSCYFQGITEVRCPYSVFVDYGFVVGELLCVWVGMGVLDANVSPWCGGCCDLNVLSHYGLETQPE